MKHAPCLAEFPCPEKFSECACHLGEVCEAEYFFVTHRPSSVALAAILVTVSFFFEDSLVFSLVRFITSLDPDSEDVCACISKMSSFVELDDIKRAAGSMSSTVDLDAIQRAVYSFGKPETTPSTVISFPFRKI